MISPSGEANRERPAPSTGRVRYYLKEYAESFTQLGTLHIVMESHGTCGCGLEEMKSVVGYFPDRADAIRVCHYLNLEDLQRQTDGPQPPAGGKA